MKKEAECKNCGAIYEFDGEKLPRGFRCLCDSKEFKILANAVA